MKTLPVALQLYTVRDEAEQDFAKTMQTIHEMGYDYVEPAGLYGIPAAEFRRILEQNGLKAICAHVPIAELIADLDRTLADYQEIGCEYLAIPYLPEEMRPGAPGFSETMRQIERIGRASSAREMPLLYHNHDFEFITMKDGSLGLDCLYRTIPAELLQTELDVCWIKVAGQDPASYIRRYAGRSPIVHLKDFVGEKSEHMYELIGMENKPSAAPRTFEFRPLGHGVQNFPPILAAALEAGTRYVVVEQDTCQGPSLDAARESRAYLRSLGW